MNHTTIEVFFDYACPYCYRAHPYLLELLPGYPGLDVVWSPCESHPRPDRYGPHSDLMIMGMFFAQDNEIDLLQYHDAMYRATHRDHVDVEDAGALAAYASGIVDAPLFKDAVQSGAYAGRLDAANDRAYGQSDVWVVPAYRMNGHRLDPVEDVGITKKQLARFIQSAL